MLQKMRDNSQGLVAKVLGGIIIFVLTIFGFGAFTAFIGGEQPAASVNGEDITRATLGVEIERQRRRLINQMGPEADPDTIDAAALQGPVLESLINRALLTQGANEMDIVVSDSQIDAFIVANPQFQVDGRYDPELFQRALGSIGHTPITFRRDFKDTLKVAQLNGAVSETTVVTDWEVRQLAALIAQTRDIAFLSFDPAEYADQVELTDTAVDEYYQANEVDYLTEETFDFEFVTLTLGGLLGDASIAVTQEAIEDRYEQDLAAFELVDERRASHILLEITGERDEAATMALARTVQQRLSAGESFAELAREYSEDPGSAGAGGELGFTSKGAFVAEFEEALWALEIGQTSEPVQTEFGIHLILLSEARTPDYPDLATLRDEIETSLRAEQANELYAQQVRRMDELAFEAAESLSVLADELGLEIQTASGVSRAQADGPFAQPRLRNAALSDEVVEAGFNSSVVDLGDQAIVVRLTERHRPEQKPLAEVAAGIEALLLAEETARLAAEDAAGAYLALQSGGVSSRVANDFGRKWNVLGNSRRQSPDADPAVTREAFRLARPVGNDRSVGTTRTASGAEIVVTVTAVREGDYGALTESERTGLRTQLERSVGERDFAALFQDLRESASIDRS